MATIHIRTDDKLKKSANKVFNSIGLDMSNGIKIFLHQVVITNSIPFKIRTVNGFTVEEEKEMLKEAEKFRKDYKAGKAKVYETAEAMMKDLLK